MHCTSRAPELSATFSRDSVWIIVVSLLVLVRAGPPGRARRPAHLVRPSRQLLGAFDDLRQPPALELGQRTGLSDTDGVTDPGLVRLVVDVVVLAHPKRLGVERVGGVPLDAHDDRLVLFVGHHDAEAFLADAAFDHVAHASTSSSRAAAISRSRITVSTRAMSRRTCLILMGSSS